MNWLSLLSFRNVLIAYAIAVSGLAYFLWNVAERRQAEAATVKQSLTLAVQATDTAKVQIKALEIERDAFVLKRAMELKQAQAIVAQSQSEAAQALNLWLQAKERIRILSRQADCRTVMAAPICKSVTDELHAPP
jgi:autotransporter translocation and assembly factor TamB